MESGLLKRMTKSILQLSTLFFIPQKNASPVLAIRAGMIQSQMFNKLETCHFSIFYHTNSSKNIKSSLKINRTKKWSPDLRRVG